MTQEVASLVLIKPEERSDLVALYNEAVGLLEYAEARSILSIKDLEPATDDLTIIARLKKAMEGKRKEYLQPFQDHIKEVNESYKKLMAPVESADRITRDKILAFKAEQERIRREQERINAERIKLAQDEMKLNGELTESVKLVEVLPSAPTRTQTEMGSAGILKIRKYRVVNFAELPDQYKIENSALLNKVVKAGIPSIPGVEIYTEDSLRVTTIKVG